MHFVFDMKHDRRCNLILVARDYLTDIPISSAYSGVVLLKGIRIILFLAELNDQESQSTGIGNAYPEAETKEKTYVIAGR